MSYNKHVLYLCLDEAEVSSRLKGVIHSPLPGAPRHCTRGIRGKKKQWRTEVLFSRTLGMDQGCCRTAERGVGLPCSVVAIPVAFVCLLLHSRLTASQRWMQSQIRILEALTSSENAEHSPFWEDGRQVYPGIPLRFSGTHSQCPAQSLGIQPQGLTELLRERSVSDQHLVL